MVSDEQGFFEVNGESRMSWVRRRITVRGTEMVGDCDGQYQVGHGGDRTSTLEPLVSGWDGLRHISENTRPTSFTMLK